MSEWTRAVPRTDGYYWAKWCENEKRQLYHSAQVVQLRDGFVYVIGSEEDERASMFLWYNDALLFVPPSFTTNDVVRLKVEGYE